MKPSANVKAAGEEEKKNRLAALLHFCPTGTTEGEHHILRQAFVRTDEYADLMTPPPLSPRLLVGKKGVERAR